MILFNPASAEPNQSNQYKVNIMNAQAQARPSEAHANPEIMRAKSDEANRKRKERKERKAQQSRDEAQAQAKADRDREEAEARAKAEQEAREQEEAMWSQYKKAEEPKAEKKAYKQGKIKTSVDGIEFDSLAKSMAYIDPILWGKENDYRTSCWIKINRALKKDGICVYGGHTYKLI